MLYMMFKLPILLYSCFFLRIDVILVHEYCRYYQGSVLFFLLEITLTKAQNDSVNDVKFIRENKSPEGNSGKSLASTKFHFWRLHELIAFVRITYAKQNYANHVFRPSE